MSNEIEKNLRCRISKYVSPSEDIKNFVYTVLEELEKTELFIKRGAYDYRDFICKESGEVVLRESYEYEEDEHKREITSARRIIQWFGFEDEIVYEKRVDLNYSKRKLKEINRAIRQRRIDYLESAAEDLREQASLLPIGYEEIAAKYNFIADRLDDLFIHYEEQVYKYLNTRFILDFENAVISDKDHVNNSLLVIENGSPTQESVALETSAQTIKTILNTPARQPDSQFPNGLKVWESIMYQLKGDVP